MAPNQTQRMSKMKIEREYQIIENGEVIADYTNRRKAFEAYYDMIDAGRTVSMDLKRNVGESVEYKAIFA